MGQSSRSKSDQLEDPRVPWTLLSIVVFLKGSPHQNERHLTCREKCVYSVQGCVGNQRKFVHTGLSPPLAGPAAPGPLQRVQSLRGDQPAK